LSEQIGGFFSGKFSNLANFLLEKILDKSVFFLVQFLSKLAFFFLFGKISQIFYLKNWWRKKNDWRKYVFYFFQKNLSRLMMIT
jgi:hypothetical protein